MSANDRSRLLFNVVVIGGLSIICLSCSDSGGSGNPVIGPSPESLAGDYTVTETVASDTCGLSSASVTTGHVRLEAVSSGLAMIDVGFGGTCTTGACQQSGTTLTQTRTEILSSGSCTLNLESTSSLTFEGAHFTSVENRHFSYVSGDCSGFTSCDVVLEGQGDICSDCWPGCSAGPASVVIGAGSQRMVFQISPIEE